MSEAIREAFAQAHERVVSRQRAGLAAGEIVAAHADEVDVIVTDAFNAALATTGRAPAGVALVALGGYGRRELAPWSDLDLLLLFSGWPAAEQTRLNRELMYPLWDSGRELGDRVREPRDVLRNLERVDEASAVLDARYLAGDRGLFADLDGSVRRRMERARASYFKDLVSASEERHHRFGHAGHLLEPNIRDSAGGLRDIQTIAWASKLLPGGDGLDALVSAGFLSQLDRTFLSEAGELLTRVRIELHLLTGRHQDQLYLAEQDEIALRLGYPADEVRAPADRLMQGLYIDARETDAIVRGFWDRMTGRKRRRFTRGQGSRPVGDGCVLQDGRIEVIAVTDPSDDPAPWLRVFRRSVRLGVPVSRAAVNRLHEDVRDAATVPWSHEAREIFLEILQSGRDGVRALEAMDSAGLLSALLPAWEAIRCFPQRDLYHRFTVDRHLLAVVEELATSRSSADPDAHDAWSHVGDAEPLFVAGLLHDIGKGRGGDHSVVGAEVAVDAARALGLDDRSVADVAFLVREHLTLAALATRRDLNDPRTVDEAAERIGNVRLLALLFLLTRADSLSTGPEAWSSFRAALVRELYIRTRQRLEGGVPEPARVSQRLADLAETLELSPPDAERLVGPMPENWLTGLSPEVASRQLDVIREPLTPGEIRTSVFSGDEAEEFILAAADRPGLFATVAGVLALRGIDVHDAEIYTRSDGIALDVFRVVGAHGAIPADRWDRVRSDIRDALDSRLDLAAALARKASHDRRRRLPSRLRGQTRIVVDNAASDSHTIVEVHTEDQLGLLHLITRTLTAVGCDISLAKVATYGAEAVDVFYVRDLDGKPITDTDHIRRVEEALTRALKR